MKKTALLLIMTLWISFSLDGQQIVNQNFEVIDTLSATLAKSWSLPLKNASVKIDSTAFHSGRYSMRIISNKPNNWGFLQNIPINLSEFGRYRLSAWIKTDSVKNGSAGILVRALNKNKKSFIVDMQNQNLQGTNDWKKYSIDFYLDPSISNINLGGYLKGSGNIWIDEMNLEHIVDDLSSSDTAINYVRDVFQIIQKNSIRKDSINLSELQAFCLANLKGALNTSDTYPMISFLLYKIGDNHSFLMPPVLSQKYAQNSVLNQAEGHILSNGIAYITVPSVLSMDSTALVDFASNLQNLIRKLDISVPSGWIVDLRKNGGGNCWPMIAGIGPLLGEGIAGYLIEANNKTHTFSYKNGASLLDDTIQVIVKNKPYQITKTTPIAVLIGPKTGSSGEILAICFIGKSNSKFFGEPSAGLTTGNSDFKLKDGATLFLTTVIDADRNFKKYGDKIYPDYQISFSDKSYDENDDPVIISAINWIKSN